MPLLPFFAKAFNGPFLEGQTQTMKFDNIDVGTFGLVVSWLYHQKIEEVTEENSQGTTMTFPQKPVRLAKLWVLTQRLILPVLQNAAMDALKDYAFSAQEDLLDMVDYLYQEESVGEAVISRRFAVDTYIRIYEKPDAADMLKLMPRGMLVDVGMAFKNHHVGLSNSSRRARKEKSGYHVKLD